MIAKERDCDQTECTQSHRRDRRRARRAGGGVHAGGPRLRGRRSSRRVPWLGGKAACSSEAGFRFDMGPTILTIPSVLRRIFAEAGRELDDYLDLIRLDPQWRCFFTDGSRSRPRRERRRHGERLDDFAPAPTRRRLPRLPRPLRAPAPHLGRATTSGSRSAASAT